VLGLQWATREVPRKAEAAMTSLKAELRVMAESLYKPRPFCRECADHNGICPYDKQPCSPVDRAEYTLHAAVKLTWERCAKIADVQALHAAVCVGQLAGAQVAKETAEIIASDIRAMIAQLLKELE